MLGWPPTLAGVLLDFHLPAASTGPAVLLVHGGPVPAERWPAPREWPVDRRYGALLAGRGAVAVTFDHPLHGPEDYPASAAVVRAAVDEVREHPRVDGDRVALWFFSGGAPLCTEWLRTPPPWLRCVALTYPRLGGPTLPSFFRPIDAVDDVGAAAAAGVAGAMRANGLPIVLTRRARERPELAQYVSRFVTAAGDADANLTIVDDAGDEGQAVVAAAGAVLATLRPTGVASA